MCSDIDIDKLWQKTTTKGGQCTAEGNKGKGKSGRKRIRFTERFYEIISIVFYESTLNKIFYIIIVENLCLKQKLNYSKGS